MFWDVTNFMLVGFLCGIVGLVFVATNQRRAPVGLLVTIVPAMFGSVLGGLTSWYLWPAENGQFQAGGFAMSILGAAVLQWPSIEIMRRLGAI